MRNAYKMLAGKLVGGRCHLEDVGIDDNILIKVDLKEIGLRVWVELTWLRIKGQIVLLNC
jgi:hypothetical protein